MCCIFTCCGWMIDLIQRLWTFTMSCCISSAVCCALVTASMSGIALGYNYSLAEYIDLKETNVSVYLKRGVFDDEIADDMDWRRSGHMPVAGHLKDTNLVTGAPENEEMPLRSGRRLDDSMVVSDDQHKFEGSLMRLTVKPPGDRSSAEPVISDAKLAEVLEKYPSGSLDQIKAIHSLMNQRRSNSQRNTVLTTTQKERLIDFSGRRMAGLAPGGVPMFGDVPYAEDPYKNINRARLAVPDQGIGEPAQWMLADKSVPESYRRNVLMEQDLDPMSSLAYPSRIHYTKDMPRPTRPKPDVKPTHTTMNTLLREQNAIIQGPDIERFRNKLIMDKFDMTRLNNNKEPYRKSSDDSILFNSEQDYEDQANKGLPIRKKRNVEKDNANQPSTRTVFMNSMNGVRQILDKNFLEKTLMGKLITRDKGILL